MPDQSIYTGPILPGMGFIWEPKLSFAREALVVSEVKDDMVKTVTQSAIGRDDLEASRAPSGSYCLKEDPTGTWNSMERFRYAVVRCALLDEIEGLPGSPDPEVLPKIAEILFRFDQSGVPRPLANEAVGEREFWMEHARQIVNVLAENGLMREIEPPVVKSEPFDKLTRGIIYTFCSTLRLSEKMEVARRIGIELGQSPGLERDKDFLNKVREENKVSMLSDAIQTIMHGGTRDV